MAKEAKKSGEGTAEAAMIKITQRYLIYLPGGETARVEAENREDAERQAVKIVAKHIRAPG